MPISQQRMLSLIKAARDYQQALSRAESLVAESISNIAAGSSHQEELELLQWAIKSTGLLCDPMISFATIKEEEAHFKKNFSKNLRNAARMEAIRNGTWPERVTQQRHPNPRKRQPIPLQSTRADNNTLQPRTTSPAALSQAIMQNGAPAIDEALAAANTRGSKIDLTAPNVVDCEGDINFDPHERLVTAPEEPEEPEEDILAKVDIEKPLAPGAKASVDAFIEALLKEENPENKMKHEG